MVFQYNPLDYYIETTESGELLFSICRLDSLSPKLRYNLHDLCRLSSASRSLRALAGFGTTPTFLAERYLDLPLRFSTSCRTVAFLRREGLPPRTSRRRCSPSRSSLVTSFVLIVGEDAEANKTLRLQFGSPTDGRRRRRSSAPRRACSTRSSPSTRTTARQAASSPGEPTAEFHARHRPVRRAGHG